MKTRTFDVKNKVLFLKDYETENLTIGWLYKKEYNDQGFSYWYIVTNFDDINKIENDKNNSYRIKETFILKYNPKTITKYEQLDKFLLKAYIAKHCNVIGERAQFFTKKNNRRKVLIKVIFNTLSSILKYFIYVIIFGTIKLIFGDVFTYFINEHKMFNLKKKMYYAKIEDQVYSVNKNINRTSKVSQVSAEIDNLKNNNVEINRSLIATLIAIFSLLIALK